MWIPGCPACGTLAQVSRPARGLGDRPPGVLRAVTTAAAQGLGALLLSAFAACAASAELDPRFTNSARLHYTGITHSLEVPVSFAYTGPLEAPTDILLACEIEPECTALVVEGVPGQILGSLSAVDADQVTGHTFTVLDDSRFEVVDGKLRLKAGVALDFETENSLQLTLRVTDAGFSTFDKTLLLRVRDINEAPFDLVLDQQLVLPGQPGAVVGTLTVADPDSQDQHRFAVLDDDRFIVVDATLLLAPAISLGAAAEIPLTLLATDRGGLTTSLAVVIQTGADGSAAAQINFVAPDFIGTPMNIAPTVCSAAFAASKATASAPFAEPTGTRTLSVTNAYAIGDPLILAVTDAARNIDPALRESVQVQVGVEVEVSGGGDRETVTLIEVAPDSGVFVGYVFSTAHTSLPNDCVLSVKSRDRVTAVYAAAAASTAIKRTRAFIAPVGIVFDDQTGEPVNGIILRLIDVGTNTLAQIRGDGPVYARLPASVVSGQTVKDASGAAYENGHGEYRYPSVAAGDYRLEIFNARGWKISDRPDSELQALNPSARRELTTTSPGPFNLSDASRGKVFHLSSGALPQIDIPVTAMARTSEPSTLTPAQVEFLQYSPDPAVGEPVNVGRAVCGNDASPAVVELKNVAVPVPGTVNLLPTGTIKAGQPVFIRVRDNDQNNDPTAREQVTVTLTAAASGDQEFLLLTETGLDSGEFVGYLQSTEADAVTVDCQLTVEKNQTITIAYTDGYDKTDTADSIILVDPFGKVFSTANGDLLNGVRVTLVDNVTGLPAQVFGDGPAFAPYPHSVITGGSVVDAAGQTYDLPAGEYRFPFVTPGFYRLVVEETPEGFVFPSTLAASALQQLPGAPYVIVPGSDGRVFEVPVGPSVRIDLAVDAPQGEFFVAKQASKHSAAIGEFIQYKVTVGSAAGDDFSQAQLQDRLPQGFRLQPGSLRLNREPAADPQVSADGRTLLINLPAVATALLDVTYVAEITSGAKLGPAINTASVIGARAGPSNAASATVMVTEDLFRNKAVLLGNVYLSECVAGQVQDRKGMPGVRIYMQDGTYVVTDSDGSWHVEGVEPGTHVVQLDVESLPQRYAVSSCQTHSRYAGTAYSQFVDVQGGTLWRADFHIQQKPPPQTAITLTQTLRREGQGIRVLVSVVKDGAVALRSNHLVYTVPAGWSMVEGSAQRNGRAVVPQASITGLIVPLDNGPDQQQIEFLLRPATLTLGRNGAAALAPAAGASSAARLLFSSVGTVSGKTASSLVQMDRLAGNVDLVSVSVSAEALGSWDQQEAAAAPGAPARDPDIQGFINIAEGSRLMAATNTVKFDLDSRLQPRLFVDGQQISNEKIGFRAIDEVTGKTNYGFIGVEFGAPGTHTVQLQGLDGFGNVSFAETVRIVRVGELYDIRQAAETNNISDGSTPVTVRLELRDRAGELITARYTLEYSSDELVAYDHNKSLSDLAQIKGANLVDVGMDGLVRFNPVSRSGKFAVKLRYKNVTRDLAVFVAPEKREWIMVGLAEGSIAQQTLAGNMENLAAAGFEDEFSRAGRVAFYAKGQVRGEYILTLAYDTDKDSRGALGQAIDPGAYYTLYGDMTTRQHDASSQRKLYLKLERETFHGVFGDFNTGLSVTELSAYSRTLNGVKTEFKGEHFELKTFLSQASQAFIKDEIRGDGTSGEYRLSNQVLITNSEKIKIQTRDRFHSEAVLAELRLTRHVDYTIDYAQGTLFFKQPVYSQDTDFNPTFIVVDYEVPGAGRNELNAGGRLAYRLSDTAEAGLSLIREGVEGRRAELVGVDVNYALSRQTQVKVEAAATRSEIDGIRRSGGAYVAELQHRAADLEATAYLRQQANSFGLGQQNASAGGTRKMGVRTSYKVTDAMRYEADVYRQSDLGTQATEDVAAATLRYQADDYALHSGLRAAQSSAGTTTVQSHLLNVGGSYNLLEDRVRLNAAADTPLGGNAEVGNFPQRLRVGLDYKLNSQLTLTAEQELSWGKEDNSQGTRVGISSRPWGGGEIVSNIESRADESSQRMAAVAGLRQHWQAGASLGFDFGVDRSQTIRQVSKATIADSVPPALRVTTAYASPGNSDFTSVTVGSAFRKHAWDWTARVEYKDTASEAKLNLLSDVIHNLDKGRQILAKVDVQRINGESRENISAKVQLAYSYRPPDSDWRLLNRLDLAAVTSSADDPDTPAASRTRKFVNNLSANYMLSAATQVSLQYGLKYVLDNIDSDEYRGFTDLYGLEVRHNIGNQWDLGLQGSRYTSWHAANSDYSYGVSVGYSPAKNLWMSLGYNFAGFSDSDFSASDYTAQGIFLKYRFKFDQHSIEDLLDIRQVF